MRTLPLFLKTTGQRIIIIGGGEQATQKARLSLKTDAHLTVFAEHLTDELTREVEKGRLNWSRDWPTVAALSGARVVFIALECIGAAVAAAALAREAGTLVNMVDSPAWSDAYMPSIVDRDPITVAIGTEGSAPILGRRIRAQLEEMLPERLGEFAAYAGSLRPRVARNIAKTHRMTFWRQFFSPELRDGFLGDDARKVMGWVEAALASHQVTGEDGMGQGRISFLVMPRMGHEDLLSLRAARRLQETELMIYPETIAEALLDMARRDAVRRPISTQHPAQVKDVSASVHKTAGLISEAMTEFNTVAVFIAAPEQAIQIIAQLHQLPDAPVPAWELIDIGPTPTG